MKVAVEVMFRIGRGKKKNRRHSCHASEKAVVLNTAIALNFHHAP